MDEWEKSRDAEPTTHHTNQNPNRPKQQTKKNPRSSHAIHRDWCVHVVLSGDTARFQGVEERRTKEHVHDGNQGRCSVRAKVHGMSWMMRNRATPKTKASASELTLSAALIFGGPQCRRNSLQSPGSQGFLCGRVLRHEMFVFALFGALARRLHCGI